MSDFWERNFPGFPKPDKRKEKYYREAGATDCGSGQEGLKNARETRQSWIDSAGKDIDEVLIVEGEIRGRGIVYRESSIPGYISEKNEIPDGEEEKVAYSVMSYKAGERDLDF